jgi:hypothetical protein
MKEGRKKVKRININENRKKENSKKGIYKDSLFSYLSTHNFKYVGDIKWNELRVTNDSRVTFCVLQRSQSSFMLLDEKKRAAKKAVRQPVLSSSRCGE